MLDATAIRILGIVMSIGALAGAALFVRAQSPGGRRREARAQDNPPRILQVLWPTLVALVVFAPFLPALAPELATSTALNVTFPFDMVVQLVGFLLWGAGGVLVVWSGRTLGRFMVPEIVVSKDHELIQAGPYAYVRHPTYAGTIAMASGVTLVLLNLGLAALALAVVLLADYRARKEERLLSSPEGFGETYASYMARTGRFLPRLRT